MLEKTEQIQEIEVYQGRWGYYSCGFETYKQIKRLNFLYYQNCRSIAKRKRYDRKEPQNRYTQKAIKDKNDRKIGYGEKKPMSRPLCLPDLNDPNFAYNMAICRMRSRYPVDSPDLVKRLPWSKRYIIDMFVKAEEWYRYQNSKL